MIAIVGLGNPGAAYENTRHNIGFITLNRFAERHGISVLRLKHKALTGDGFVNGRKVFLAKPQTFMNESGISVREIYTYYDIAPENLCVIYDDVDIPAGSLRIRKKGSAGSHNGMKSLIYQLESDGFPRFRIGIGADRGCIPLHDFVLSGFDKNEIEAVRSAVDRCVDALDMMLLDGIEAAMREFNG